MILKSENIDSNLILKVRGITKSYYKQKSSNSKLTVLENVSFDVEKGESVSIIGKSGVGKTTLLRIIGTLEKPDTGKVYLRNTELTNLKGKKLIEVRRKKIGFVFQENNLIPVLTAQKNVELPMILTGTSKREREKRAKELLSLVGLENRLNHLPSELSSGEQQRVAIARALANNPEILLADEPTANLDEDSTETVLDLLRRINEEEKQTLLMITHDIKVAKRAKTILRVEDKKLKIVKGERDLLISK